MRQFDYRGSIRSAPPPQSCSFGSLFSKKPVQRSQSDVGLAHGRPTLGPYRQPFGASSTLGAPTGPTIEPLYTPPAVPPPNRPPSSHGHRYDEPEERTTAV